MIVWGVTAPMPRLLLAPCRARCQARFSTGQGFLQTARALPRPLVNTGLILVAFCRCLPLGWLALPLRSSRPAAAAHWLARLLLRLFMRDVLVDAQP